MGAGMQEIAQWLEKLGLGQYAQRFGENDIDLPILSDLTDQDLKELGALQDDRLTTWLNLAIPRELD